MVRKLVSVAITCCFVGSVSAEADIKNLLEMDLDEILKVNVATGTSKAISEAPSIVSVITQEDIKAMGATTLAEAVEQIPGLHVSNSVNRLTSLFGIRGIRNNNTPNVLVLIDGVNIAEITALSVPYAFRYPVNFIKRIELIRGPGSAVYGADAFSGVINIITQSPSDFAGTSAGVNVGSFDYSEAWINSQFSVDDLSVALSITRQRKGNDSERVTQYGVLQRDGEFDNIHVNATYHELTFNGWYWRSEQEMGSGAGIIGNDIDRDISETISAQLRWVTDIDKFTRFEMDTSYTNHKLDGLFQLFPEGTWPVGDDGNLFLPPFTPVNFPDGVIGNPIYESYRYRLNSALVFSGFDNHRVRLGIGAERAGLKDVREFKNFGPGVLDVNTRPLDLISDEIIDVSGTPFVYTPNFERDIWYVSLQDEWQVSDDVALTAGVRYDKYSDFGSTVNPRLALVYSATDKLTLKALYGSAFRAPKAAELVFINNPTTLGNPDLKPEEIQTFELVFDYRFNSKLKGSLNAFNYESDELIELDDTFIFQNIGQQDGKGIEAELNWQVSEQLTTRINVSFLDAQLTDRNADKDQVPRFSSFLDLRYQFAPTWLMSVQSNWITGRERQLGDARPTIDDYHKVDVTLLWEPGRQWSARLTARNVFNDDIREPSPNTALFSLGLGFPNDFPMEGRNVVFSISYLF
jgi:iron complex outermembrane receptor protein